MSNRHPALTIFPTGTNGNDFEQVQARKLPISYSNVGWYVAAFEGFLIVFLAALSSLLYDIEHWRIVSNPTTFLAVGLTFSVLFTLGMQAQGLYRPSVVLHPGNVSKAVIVTWIGVFCMMLVFGFLAKVSSDFSRSVTLEFFFAGAIALPLYRQGTKRVVASAIANKILAGRKHIVLFGDQRQFSARGIFDNLSRHGYKILGQFHVAADDTDTIEVCREVASSFGLMRAFLQQNKVDEIFLIFRPGDQRLIDLVTGQMSELPLPVRLVLDHNLSRMLQQPLLDLGTATAVKIQSGPLTDYQQRLKRVFDIVASGFGLVVLAPLLLGVALAIKLDSPGPVMFRQRRAGFSGRTFYIYKFRSMTTLDDGEFVVQARRNDKRVTRVGRYIRKTSIDELPQLLNVLCGEMSIVGPRPHALSHDTQYSKLISTYALRHHMKPGITGWAQVNGCRGETADVASMKARIQHDLWYIVHWSMLLDIKAIGMTLIQVFRPVGVY